MDSPAATDCCRFDGTFSAQWNTAAITDYLSAINSYSASVLPQRIYYYANEGSISNGWCLDGNIACRRLRNSLPLAPYPNYYAYLLVNGPGFLNLAGGGHLANSISPAATTAGVSAAGWYTSKAGLCLS